MLITWRSWSLTLKTHSIAFSIVMHEVALSRSSCRRSVFAAPMTATPLTCTTDTEGAKGSDRIAEERCAFCVWGFCLLASSCDSLRGWCSAVMSVPTRDEECWWHRRPGGVTCITHRNYTRGRSLAQRSHSVRGDSPLICSMTLASLPLWPTVAGS